jgi:hypothetical protein
MCCVCGIVFVLALTASCSSLPKSSPLDEAHASMRAEYLENHPDGKYNAHINEGRVVKGMGVEEVLAAWGVPNQRRSWKHDNAENWTYYARDEHTGQVLGYELVFEEQLLARWVVDTDATTSLGTTPVAGSVNRTVEETLKLGAAAGTTVGSTPKKK